MSLRLSLPSPHLGALAMGLVVLTTSALRMETDTAASDERRSSEFKLVPADLDSDHHFGRSVSMDGNRLLIGAPASPSTSYPGAAYLYRWDGASWVLESKFWPVDGAAYDSFGAAVSLSGDWALVGAPGDDVFWGPDAGSAYVYRRLGGIWGLVGKLRASDARVAAEFGSSVAIGGEVALVGAPWHPTEPFAFGVAYVFSLVGNDWVQVARLVPSDASMINGTGFGFVLSLGENAALIGAPDDSEHFPSSGAAYAFRWTGSEWVEESKLTAEDPEEGARFGYSVSLGNDGALVGAYMWDGPGMFRGAAYAYDYDATVGWRYRQRLTPVDSSDSLLFGFDVSLDGRFAFIGAPGALQNRGAAYLFRRASTGWIEDRKLEASDGQTLDRFGESVAILAGTALIGAPDLDGVAENTGAAYVFTDVAP